MISSMQEVFQAKVSSIMENIYIKQVFNSENHSFSRVTVHYIGLSFEADNDTLKCKFKDELDLYSAVNRCTHSNFLSCRVSPPSLLLHVAHQLHELFYLLV